MKVKNEYVEIKIGNKTYRHQNMILDEYLKRLFNMQLDISRTNCVITQCYLKLDAPLENVEYDSQIPKSSFDITMSTPINNELLFLRFSERNENSIKMNYTFNNNSYFYVDGVIVEATEINRRYANRRIMGIGFGNSSVDNIYAYLDTSNMNIVINSGEEISIVRVDSIQSDGVCDGLEYPLHLVNDIAKKDVEVVEIQHLVYENFFKKAQLYSVGFGNVKGIMEEEYLIDDLTLERTDTSISFNINRTKNVGKYPSNNLMPGFYPLKDNSKYLIFKYRLYMANTPSSRYYYLDDYYTMSMPNETFGNLNIKLKIERL